MTATMCKFTERAVLQGRVDRAAGVIRGVRILGERSRNGRRYTQEAMRGAVHLYNGAKVYKGHPKKSEMEEDRPWDHWVGILQNVRFEGGGIVGDLKLRKESKHFADICEAAEDGDFNRSFGLSHEANGDSRYDRDSGEEIIERITDVYAVAIVTEPATNAGLFEAAERFAGELQRDIDQLRADAKAFYPKALNAIRLAHAAGEGAITGHVTTELAGISRRLELWIADERAGIRNKDAMRDEAKAIRDSIADMFAGPSIVDAPRHAKLALDALVSLIGHLAAGVTDSHVALESEWRKSRDNAMLEAMSERVARSRSQHGSSRPFSACYR